MTAANTDLIDRIRAAAARDAAFLRVHAEFGVRAVDAHPGRTAFGQVMGPHLLDAGGRLCPGAFLVAIDAALGSAIATGVPSQRGMVSLAIHAQFVALDPGAARDFTIRAESAHVGEGSGFAVGTIDDDSGRTVAHIASHCAFTAPPRSVTGPLPPILGFDETGSPAPAADGLAPVASRRAGARMVRSTDGEVTITGTSTPEMRNSRNELQGGVLGLLVEQAITACIVQGSPALAHADTMDLNVNYVRAVRADHPNVEITARSEHAGRRFAVARARACDNSGRVVALASGSRF